MRHATDSDHVVAVTAIVSRQRRISSAAGPGFSGGSATASRCSRLAAPSFFWIVVPERLGMSLEFGVALMLILLGVLNLHATFRAVENVSAETGTDNTHQHTHLHGDYVHTHTHSHGHEPATHGHPEDAVPPAKLDRWFGSSRFYQALRPLVIGTVHGLAGSAAVALLVLPIIHDPVWAIGYLLIFGVGTIAGMMLITAAIAVPVSYSTRFQFLHRHLGTDRPVF